MLHNLISGWFKAPDTKGRTKLIDLVKDRKCSWGKDVKDDNKPGERDSLVEQERGQKDDHKGNDYLKVSMQSHSRRHHHSWFSNQRLRMAGELVLIYSLAQPLSVCFAIIKKLGHPITHNWDLCGRVA